MKSLVKTTLFLLFFVLFVPATASALEFQEVEDEEPTVSRKELREAIKSSMAALKAANRGRSLRDSQVEEVEDNLYDLMDEDLDDHGELGEELRHFMGMNDDLRTSRDWTGHLQQCGTCNDIHLDLLDGLSIRPVPFRDGGGIASQCSTSRGSCPMMVSIPIGSACHCNWGYPYGWAPGIAR
ncbi:MAG: hypothetical protein K0U98_16005 [Deltaproteobacteria bacterium]|nr:hypothetical protein [Deltaproteobacteria bacterium]